MKSFWLNPEGYQRTSKEIQYRCLQTLLKFAEPRGHLLDIGCGTGNALSCSALSKIESYHGVDLSSKMIDFAKSRHSGSNIIFEVSDFLECKFQAKRFDTIICAACLHWFVPRESEVVFKIAEYLTNGGYLFLSCASDFVFFGEEREIQMAALHQVREMFPTIAPSKVFDDYRFTPTSLSLMLQAHGLRIVKINRIEEQIQFQSQEDFHDWHLGSGSVLYSQFEEQSRQHAVDVYYDLLFQAYKKGNHRVGYSTTLLLVEKMGEACIPG